MLKEYNVLLREYGNGLKEIRLYKKGFNRGDCKETPKKMHDFFIEPFEGEKIKCSNFLDGDGFTIQRDKINMQKSLNRTISKIYDYSNSNQWEWFCTFTFDNEKINRYDYDCVAKYMSTWLNNVKKRYCPTMKYILVPELHKDGAYHFHGLFSSCDGLGFVFAVNNQEFCRNGKKNKYWGQPLLRKGRQVYNISRFTVGYTDCEKIVDSYKASNYIMKYITKDLLSVTQNKKRYWCSRGLEVPKEKTLLALFYDFDDFKNQFALNLVKKYENIYTNSVALQHGDFDNEIHYFKFNGDFDLNTLFHDIDGMSCGVSEPPSERT